MKQYRKQPEVPTSSMQLHPFSCGHPCSLSIELEELGSSAPSPISVMNVISTPHYSKYTAFMHT